MHGFSRFCIKMIILWIRTALNYKKTVQIFTPEPLDKSGEFHLVIPKFRITYKLYFIVIIAKLKSFLTELRE